jgi:hypothetical protein
VEKKKQSEVKCLDGLLVGLGLGLVGGLVKLVRGSAHGTGDTVGDGVVGGVALGLGVGDLANDTLVRLVDVGGRHFDRGEVGWFGLEKCRKMCL